MERVKNPQMEENLLLNKWENQYGGIKDRQFHVEDPYENDKFSGSQNRKLSNFNNPSHFECPNIDQDIPEELPNEPEIKVYIENPLLKKSK